MATLALGDEGLCRCGLDCFTLIASGDAIVPVERGWALREHLLQPAEAGARG